MGLALTANLYLASQRALSTATASLVYNANMATELLAQSMSGLVYTYQSDEAGRLASDFLQYDQFAYVRIMDTQQRVFASAARPSSHDVFTIERPLLGPNAEPLGRLEVGVSRDSIASATYAGFIYDSIVGSAQILLTLLVVYFGTSKMVTALARARDEMNERSQTDAQTGLLNRRGVQARMTKALAQSPGQGFGVIHVDLDHFKEINDTYGHAIGDRVLVEIAARMRSVAKDGDLLARIGGDEFLVITPLGNTPASSTLDYARVLVEAASQPMHGDVLPNAPGASAGAYDFALTAMEDLERAMVRADIALYQAKREGRSQALAYHDMMRQFVSQEDIVAQLERGLVEDEFAPWFEPRINIASGKLEGIQAQARWRRADGAVPAPDELPGAGQKHDILARIDQRIFEKATEALARLHQAGLDHMIIGIDLPVARLDDPTLCRRLTEQLAHKRLEPRHLSLSLSQAAVADHANGQATLSVEQLAAAGFGIELSEFGLDHSSIINLSQLPVSSVKIGRRFLAGIDQHPDRRAALQTVIDVARRFGVTMVAQGVETSREWDMLGRMRVETAQGHFAVGLKDSDQLEAWCMGWEIEAGIKTLKYVAAGKSASTRQEPSAA